MFHDNASQLVVNLDYQLDKKQLAFMITETFRIRCYTIKFDLSLDSLQHNIMACLYGALVSHLPEKLGITSFPPCIEIQYIPRIMFI